MSSFSCPHLDFEKMYCLRLRTDCVPGRPGCVLGGRSGFAFPLEERLANRPPSTKPTLRTNAETKRRP